MLISICIPTYNSGTKLNRLLDSILIQTYKQIEIVISDDSNNNDVKVNIDKHYSKLGIKYYHNAVALGTPNNWNHAVAKATGEWIKLMHHDDWFNGDNALQTFVNAAKANDKANLVFCSYSNVNLDNGHQHNIIASTFDIFLLKNNYLNLFKNFIGNPSCTLLRASQLSIYYDVRIKWFIDFDFYLGYFKHHKAFAYIKEPLITFAIHKQQVTTAVYKNPVVEVPEAYLLFEKHGITLLKNLFAYDFFWRMFRNLQLPDISGLEYYLGKKNKYKAVSNIITLQNGWAKRYLNIGIISKLLMLWGYCKNRL